MSRIARLCELVGEKFDCAIITSDENRRYFTGMKSTAGTLVCFREQAYLIIDFRYIEKARQIVRDCVVIEQNRLYKQIQELFKKHNAKSYCVEAKTMTLYQAEVFKRSLAGLTEMDTSDFLSETIEKMRCVKDSQEIEKMTQAQRIAERAFENTLNYISADRTEREIALYLDNQMLTGGAEGISFDTIVLTGTKSSMPHGVPEDIKLQENSFLLFDFGAVVDGYHSDMSRTISVGQTSDKMAEIYNVVLEAQIAGVDFARANITCGELDEVSRKIIREAGYGECFGHSLGHGVGLEIHELPTVANSVKTVLKTGMVVTIEPGIYISGEFGVRIEDMVVINDNDCHNFALADKKLLVI